LIATEQRLVIKEQEATALQLWLDSLQQQFNEERQARLWLNDLYITLLLKILGQSSLQHLIPSTE